MTDSNVRERLDAKHTQIRERRIEAIKRWIEYLESEPPETWGPQLNAVVDGQLDAARCVDTSVEHKRHVKSVAKEIREARDDDGTDSA